MMHSVLLVAGLRLLHGGVVHPRDARPRGRRPRTAPTPGSTCSTSCRCRLCFTTCSPSRIVRRQLHLRARRHDLDVAHAVRFRPRRRPARLQGDRLCQPGPPHAGRRDLADGASWPPAHATMRRSCWRSPPAAPCSSTSPTRCRSRRACSPKARRWTEFGPFRLGVWSKPFAIISILGALLLCYAGTQPPFDPIILPLFPDLPVPLNWLTNPLVFIAVALAVGWFGVEVPPLQGPADRRRDRAPPGRDRRGREGASARGRLTHPPGAAGPAAPSIAFPEPCGS